LRRLLRPFTFRTPHINKGASVYLLTENGLLHRTVGLTWEGLRNGMAYSYKTLRYSTLADQLALTGLKDDLDKHPFFQDLVDFERLVRKFIEDYVKVYYPNDVKDVQADEALQQFWNSIHFVTDSGIPALKCRHDIVDLFTNFVVYVTALHNHVGNVAEYLMNPRFAVAKLRPHREISDVQASFQSMLVALLTGWKVPKLLGDFSHVLLQDQHLKTTTLIFAEFQASLSNLADVVEKRNEGRRFPTNSVNPRRMTSSVSI